MAATQAVLIVPKEHEPKHAFEKAAKGVIRIIGRNLPADAVRKRMAEGLAELSASALQMDAAGLR